MEERRKARRRRGTGDGQLGRGDSGGPGWTLRRDNVAAHYQLRHDRAQFELDLYPTTHIPKKEQDKHKPSGYRLISVLCNLSKTLEKIIFNRLNWYVQRFNLLSSNQHGFRKSHSTSDCHVKIETEILESYANKQTMILISLDLQKAYDTVW